MPPDWSLKKCCIFFVFTFTSLLAIYPLGVKDQCISSYLYLRSICQYFKATFKANIRTYGSEAFRTNFNIWRCFLCIEVSFGNEGQKKLKKSAILSWKPRSHVRILIYQTWLISGKIRSWLGLVASNDEKYRLFWRSSVSFMPYLDVFNKYFPT